MLLKNPRRKIIWQYWRSPFGDDSETEFVDEEAAEVKSAWELRERGGEEDPKTFSVRPVVATPMGFMPIQPFQSFNESFEFWMGHANFNISKKVRDTIDEIPGVEILDVITRYCFRIAVGKAFVGREVKLDIQRALGAMPPKQGEVNPTDMKLDEETEEKVEILQRSIKDKFPYWAIYVMPNGEIDVAGTNTEDGLEMHLSLYKSAQDLAGGIIYQYA